MDEKTIEVTYEKIDKYIKNIAHGNLGSSKKIVMMTLECLKDDLEEAYSEFNNENNSLENNKMPRKLSEHYTKNWEQTNEWLNENAPDYVNQCIQELSLVATNLCEHTSNTSKLLDEASNILEENNKILSEINVKFNKPGLSFFQKLKKYLGIK